MSSVTDGSSNPSGEPQRPCTANDASNPAAASSHLHPLTFWCHECDMSVSIHPSSHSPFLCPDCFRCDSLVPLDYPLPPFISLRSLRQPSSHLAPTTNRSIAAADVDSDADILDLPPRPVPATKESISSIPTIEIAEQSVLCAICKDDLPRGSSARLLPCSHLYHSDCIVSWLSLRNSCPLCRSPIACSGRSQTPRYRLRIFEPEDEERINLEASIRQILQVRVAMAVEVSPSQIGMDEIGSMGSASSGETVSSDWPVGSVWGAGEEADAIFSDVWQDFFD
ncbi:hypothetical protein HPP92_005765 [Vanilla planifolia]|uniref:RING-type E3 ubiquitin transferase n=1 Tax=Vanilla planifolia TaxID=51239 RepID=A0A835VBA2_VANPL|nr:hypothetical protein HPP92_005765 [Vanilla planifolia]